MYPMLARASSLACRAHDIRFSVYDNLLLVHCLPLQTTAVYDLALAPDAPAGRQAPKLFPTVHTAHWQPAGRAGALALQRASVDAAKRVETTDADHGDEGAQHGGGVAPESDARAITVNADQTQPDLAGAAGGQHSDAGNAAGNDSANVRHADDDAAQDTPARPRGTGNKAVGRSASGDDAGPSGSDGTQVGVAGQFRGIPRSAHFVPPCFAVDLEHRVQFRRAQ